MRTFYISAEIIALIEEELMKKKKRKSTPKASKGKKKEVLKSKPKRKAMKTVETGVRYVHTVEHRLVIKYPDGSVEEFPPLPPPPEEKKPEGEGKTDGCCCDKLKE